MRIDRNGHWFYNGTPIGRPALVRLFASVLAREGERHVLVTPSEKVGIAVEDAPFLAVEMAEEEREDGARLVFRTNLDDIVACDAAHPLRFSTEAGSGGLLAYIYVRRGLWARLTRPAVIELTERLVEREAEGRSMLGILSGGAFFPVAPADTVDRV